MPSRIALSLCPDGHLDGPQHRVIWGEDRVLDVRELPEDPGAPNLARCEVQVWDDGAKAPKWIAVAQSFDDVAAQLGVG